MGLLDAGMSLVSQDWSQDFTEQMLRQQQQFNHHEAVLDRQWQQMMWMANNAYNSPAEQMARARAAGLNPSLLYGQPISEAQMSPSGAQASSSSGSGNAMNLGGIGSEADIYTKLSLAAAQRDLIRTQADEIRSRIPVNEAKVGQIRAATDDLVASVTQRVADVQLKFAQTRLTDEQRENISFEQMMKQNYFELDKQKMYKDFQLTDAQIEKLGAETRSLIARANVTERELNEMIWTFAVRAQGLQKQNMLTDAQINQANATADKLRKEGIRLAQVVALDKPNEINAQQWADDLSGKNGVVNQVGSNITYQIVNTIERVGGILLK